MPDFNDLVQLVRESGKEHHLPAIWDFFPCHAGAVGGVADFLKYYFDVEEKLHTQIKLQDVIPEALILPGVFPDLGVVVEVSAFGGPIQWFEQGAPFIGAILSCPEDIDKLKPPKPGLAGLMPLQLTQRAVMHRKMGEMGRKMERWAMSMGPAEVAGLLMGYEMYYLTMYDDPRRLTKLMQMVTEFIIGWLKKQRGEFGGIDIMCIGDHVCNQVTPEQMREFILPYLQTIFEAFPEPVKIYHNEGRHSDEHIQMVLEYGADIWHFGSDVHAVSDLFDKIEDRIVLFGGVNPHGVMLHGTPDDVRAETGEVLKAAEGRRMLVSTGTGTTPEVTLENQRAMIETVVAG